MNERKFEAALSEFGGIEESDPKYPEATYHSARILIAANKADRAVKILPAVTTRDPGQSKLWQIRAEAVALGGTAEDEAAFVRDLKSAPIEPALRISLQDRFGAKRKEAKPERAGMGRKEIGEIVTLLSRRNFVKAETQARLAASKHPKSALAANLLAIAQDRQQKDAQARENFLRAIKLDPTYSDAYFNLGRQFLERRRIGEATEFLRKALILSPGMTAALVALGSILNQSNEHNLAVILLERAARDAPNDVVAQRELGNAYMKTNRAREAEAAFEKARQLADDKISPEHRVALAQMQAKNGHEAKAMETLDRALAEAPDFSAALSSKASMLQSLGAFSEAETLVQRALEADPGNAEAYRILMASYKAKEGDPIVESMLETWVANALPDPARSQLAFALSKAMEDMGRHDRVFEFVNEANRLVRKAQPYAIEKRRREMQVIRKTYQDFDFQSAAFGERSDTAPIFVTGMPRSGTTLVEQIIASHSGVSSAGELGFASELSVKLIVEGDAARRMGDIGDDEIAKLGKEYAAYIDDLMPEAVQITDKAITTYMHIGLLKLAMPKARFIVVRRDPRDNLLSIYKNKFPDGTHPYAYDLEDLAHYYGTFVEMIDFWRERVPDWFYEVQYETLVANPEEESRKLIEACGLEWEDACLNFHQNKNKVQTLSVYQVRQPISKGSVKGWKRYETELEPMLKILREAGHVTD